MMVSPMSIFDELKGKPESEIRKAIRGFKNQIGSLKNRIENANDDVQMSPSYELQLQMNREYLSNAILALTMGGFEYAPSRAEEKSTLFNDGLTSLKRVDFTVGGFHEGYTDYVIKFNDTDEAVFEIYRFRQKEEGYGTISKRGCISKLQSLYIGEWKKRYWADVLDGTQWELKLTFADNKVKKYYGSNAYPFSYKDLIDAIEEWEFESWNS